MTFKPWRNGFFMLLLLGASSVPVQSHAQTYKATTLGSITFGAAINGSGEIAGYTVETGMDQAFVWANGTLTYLNESGGFFGQAFAINAGGQIVGTVAGLTGSTNQGDATLWNGGTVTSLTSMVSGSSTAYGINASGQVVGTTSSNTSNACSSSATGAFLWSGGTLSSLAPSALNSSATAINDAGSAVGIVQSLSGCTSQAALFAGGTTTILPQLPATNGAIPNAINNAGQIVGYVPLGNGQETPLLWFNGSVTALPGVGDAMGINNKGQIVGQILSFNQTEGEIAHAALWTSATAQPLDLNDLIDPATPIAPINSAGPPLVLISATAINDNGWIVANASPDNGTTYQAFLLQPETFTLNVTPGSLTFASQQVATTSAAQTVTVKNTGTTVFSVTGIQVSGDYAQTNTCGTSIAAGSQCSISVKFTPTAPGTRPGVLTLATAGTSYTANLTGTGAITVSLTASAATEATGTPVTLTWTAPGTTCTATGGSSADGWTGGLAASGSKPVTEPSSGKYTYGITCTGGGQSASAQAVVTDGAPTVDLAATPTSVSFGKSTTLTWTSTFSTSCTATGGANGDGWAATKSTAGSASITESASGSYAYTLACGTGSVTAKSSVTVTVNAAASGGSPGSGSGGGGAIDAIALLSLASLLGMRQRRSKLIEESPR
jgi:probable HAF family extracellular repeat protein